MRLDMNIFQIAAKYAANLMGIATPEEREALENWKQESVWHTNLAERLDQEEDFKENQQLLERFSVTEAWKKMEKNLDKAMGRRAGGRCPKKKPLIWTNWKTCSRMTSAACNPLG